MKATTMATIWLRSGSLIYNDRYDSASKGRALRSRWHALADGEQPVVNIAPLTYRVEDERVSYEEKNLRVLALLEAGALSTLIISENTFPTDKEEVMYYSLVKVGDEVIPLPLWVEMLGLDRWYYVIETMLTVFITSNGKFSNNLATAMEELVPGFNSMYPVSFETLVREVKE